MMTPIDRGEAVRALAEVERRRREVARGGPNGYAIAIAWGLFVLIFLPLFDFFPGQIIGPTMSVGAVIGAILTSVYARRCELLKVIPRLDNKKVWVLLWIRWTIWYIVVLAAAEWLSGRVALTWTMAGILSALPLFIYGLRGLRERAAS